MKRILATLLLVSPLVAGAQTPGPDAYSQPPTAQPQAAPPPPPATLPEPPAATAPAPSDEVQAPLVQEAPAAPSGSGQWVYTGQYGWLWLPYGDAYTYSPAGVAAPDMYVYYPAFGWTWVAAPWVWGLGPRPFFGVYGFARFGWYGRGYGRWYGFAPRYAGWGAPRYWAGHGWAAPHSVYRGPHVVARGGFGGGHVGFHGGHAGHAGHR